MVVNPHRVTYQVAEAGVEVINNTSEASDAGCEFFDFPLQFYFSLQKS